MPEKSYQLKKLIYVLHKSVYVGNINVSIKRKMPQAKWICVDGIIAFKSEFPIQGEGDTGI